MKEKHILKKIINLFIYFIILTCGLCFNIIDVNAETGSTIQTEENNIELPNRIMPRGRVYISDDYIDAVAASKGWTWNDDGYWGAWNASNKSTACYHGNTWGVYCLGVKQYPSCQQNGIVYIGCVTCWNYVSWANTSTLTIGKSSHTSVYGGTKDIHTKCSVCGGTTSSTHSYTKTVQTAATCTTKGTTKYTCACGYSYTAQDIAINSSNHTGKSTNGGTSAVHTKYSCCGATISKTHSYTTTTTKAATCTADGTKKHTCACGYSYTSTITKLGHNFATTYTVDKAATCTTAGSKSQHCSRCTATQNVTAIAATGHSYGTPTYTWSGTTSCTAKRICSTCNTAQSQAGTITNKITKAATCTAAGTRTYTATFTNTAFTTQTKTATIAATGHAYGTVTYTWSGYTSCTAKRTCSTCSNVESGTATITNAVTKAATCTATGVKTYTAKFSNSAFAAQTKTETIAATGHKYATPTYTWSGVTNCTAKRICSTCNNAESGTATITNAVTKAATCTAAGTRAYTAKFSNSAFATQTKTETISATGHSYGDYTTTKEATCTIDGSKQRTCLKCSNVETATITKLGHDFASDYTIDKEATCTTTGSKSQHCSRCTSTQNVTTIAALGHSYDTPTYTWSDVTSCTAKRTCSRCDNVESGTATITNAVTKAATCTATGTRTYTAKFSNSAFATQTKTQSIAKIAHTNTNGGTKDIHTKCSVCGGTTSSTHSYTKTTVTAATCTTKGTTKYTCVCGYSYTVQDIPIDSTNHTGKIINAGEKDIHTKYDCCDKIVSDIHTYTITAEKIPTCTETGINKYSCDCGYNYIEIVAALGHVWGDFTIDLNETCTTDGSKSIHCANCDVTKDITVIPATGHTEISGGTKDIHTKCSVCNKTLSNAHILVESISKEATCTEKGKTKYSCECGYNYELENIEALGHEYKSTIIKPTCTEKGYTTHICQNCNNSYNDNELDATGHNEIKGNEKDAHSKCSTCKEILSTEHNFISTIIKETSCSEMGITKYECNCGYSYESADIEKLPHTYVDKTINPSCINEGYIEHTCSICNDTYKDNVIPLTGHDYNEPTIITEATCLKDGQQEKKCKVCNNVELETIPQLGHDMQEEFTIDIPATCLKEGEKSQHCSRCSATQNKTEIPATGHTLTENIPPKCINCDYTEKLIDATGTNIEGVNLNLNVEMCDTQREIEIRNALNSQMILNNSQDTIGVIDITSDAFEDKANVIFDLKYVSNPGDIVSILHLNETTGKWENLGSFTVDENETITCDFTSFSPVVLVDGAIIENTATEKVEVYAERSSSYKITIPKSVIIDGTTKTGNYTVSVEGDISGDEYISIIPDGAFVLSSINLPSISAKITQDKTNWLFNEILPISKIIANGIISAPDLSAGSWNGNFNFKISLITDREYIDSIENIEYKSYNYYY